MRRFTCSTRDTVLFVYAEDAVRARVKIVKAGYTPEEIHPAGEYLPTMNVIVEESASQGNRKMNGSHAGP